MLTIFIQIHFLFAVKKKINLNFLNQLINRYLRYIIINLFNYYLIILNNFFLYQKIIFINCSSIIINVYKHELNFHFTIPKFQNYDRTSLHACIKYLLTIYKLTAN